MMYDVECDTCDFARTVEEGWKAYGSANEHETDHPTHVVAVRPQ